MNDNLPLIHVKGSPAVRGRAYGSQAARRIQNTFAFYDRHLFAASPLTSAQIRDRAARVADVIDAFDPHYTAEIHSIARGAALEPWQIYALNARTEILNARALECTALYFQESAVLGQTWDWVRELEQLMVLLQVDYPDGRTLLTLTEPGMLAKVGLNNAGLGVCLNILLAPHPLDGVPVHVLLRAILECPDIPAARDVIGRAGSGRSSHFMIGDDSGRCLGLEFAGAARRELHPQDGVLLHTNHCLAPDLNSDVMPTSLQRYDRAEEWLRKTGGRDHDALLMILSDQSEGNNSILCPYHPDATLGDQQVGTCATIVMDLPARTLALRRGPHPDAPFYRYTLD
ncbi:MAG: C45 family autoproteolytic acyltransferase/hydrolase [Halioglobus sp.]